MKDTQFKTSRVRIEDMTYLCGTMEGGSEIKEMLNKFGTGSFDGLAFFKPVSQNGDRNQDLQCVLLSWGGESPRKSLQEALLFVKSNFVSSLFEVSYCDNIVV